MTAASPPAPSFAFRLARGTVLHPGMFKTFVTLRTGNAWVHAIAPHVLVDTPLVAGTFAIR